MFINNFADFAYLHLFLKGYRKGHPLDILCLSIIRFSLYAGDVRCDGICRIISLWFPRTGIRRHSLPLVWLLLRDDGGVC